MKDILISALKTSGEELLNGFGQHIDFTVKESQSSIVTKADLKSNTLIVNIISECFPFHNIISEEGGFINKQSDYTWIIDPLDGTSNFAAGIPWFGVLITLLKNNIPVIGGAYLPVEDILYIAEKGKGAFRNGKQLLIDKGSELKNSLFAFSVDFTDDRAVLDGSMKIYRNLVKATRNIRSTNSLMDFLYVAEGKFGGVINLFTRVWDIAGLGLIISEAGGVIKDISGNDLLYLVNENISANNFAVMAGSEKIVTDLKNVII
jgi:myo-inositol-1(or 4)-monophosphatase